MNWKFIIVLMALVGGSIGYYLWHKVPEVPEKNTLGGYTKTLQIAEQKADAVSSAMNVKEAQGAVDRYRSEKGSTPASLQDTVPEFMDHVPGGLVYDASTGTVTAAP